MKPEPIAITEYVKNLGYKDHKTIANKIRDILKHKESFKGYLTSPATDFSKRAEKALINHDGQILVANLAVLTQFQSLFGRADKESENYPPYQYLKKHIDRDDFNIKILKNSKSLKSSIFRSNQGLKKLTLFSKSILTRDSFDITKESLTKLMEENNSSAEPLDLGNSFELGAWNELLELQEELDSGGENSELHQKIAEKLLDINEFDQAIDELNNAIALDPENGIAWAIYAKVLLPIVNTHYKKHYNALARTEFSGFIEHPITSEESWLNERVEETHYDFHTTHKNFIDASINALIFWPHWKEIPHRDGGNNYKPNLNLTTKTDIDLKRDDVFFALINKLEFSDFDRNRNQITEIIRSYQMWNPELFPLTNVHCQNFDFKVNILKVLSWISKQDIERAMSRLVKQWSNESYLAFENLNLLKSPDVKNLFWNYLGKRGFLKTYELLEGFIANNKEQEKLETICQLELNNIKNKFTSLAKKSRQLGERGFTNMFRQHNHMNIDNDIERDQLMLAKEIQHAVEGSAISISGWENYLNSSSWKKHQFSNELPHSLLILSFIAPLIELANGKNKAINIHTLGGYAKNSPALKNIVSFIDSYIVNVNELFNLIPVDNLSHKEKTCLIAVIDVVSDVQEEIAQDKADFY